MKKKNLINLIVIILLLIIGGFVYYNYFYEGDKEPLIGGCAGVHPDYLQECCENWAEENNVVHAQCVGKWNFGKDTCWWSCYSELTE